jgi:chromosome condensin MukBEF MukE localization factor
VPGCPERDALRRDRRIGMLRVVGRHQSRYILPASMPEPIAPQED